MTTNKTDENLFFMLDELFSKHVDIDGIFITNDAVYQVEEYLRLRKKEKTFKLVGFDLLTQNITALKNNSVDCIISQSPEQQGYTAVQAIYRKEILLQEPEVEYDIRINSHDKENL